MITFQVNDMTCGHCVGAITRAVKDADQEAEVRVDLDKHLVQIEPKGADAERLRAAIAEAGYTSIIL
jgi:copper chaperone